jgi:hypothetical protein
MSLKWWSVSLVAGIFCVALLFVSSASASVPFYGNFESGDLSQWAEVQANPGHISVEQEKVTQGEYGARFEVDEGEHEAQTGLPRAVLYSGNAYEESDVRYFHITGQVDKWDFNHWGMIWELPDQESFAPLALHVEKEGGLPILWLGPSDSSAAYWEAPIRVGQWFEIVIKVEFGPSGSVKVWMDGRPQEMLNHQETYSGIDTIGEGPDLDMLGINRSSSAEGSAVAYFDDYRVTETFYSSPPEPEPFVANWESGDLSEWAHVQAIPGRITAQNGVAAQGSYAGRFEVREGDEEPETGLEKAEVQSGEYFWSGEQRYFRVLGQVDSWDFEHWGIIWQLHDQSDGSPPVALLVEGTESEPTLVVGPGDGSTSYWEGPMKMGEWFEVVIHVGFGTSGSVEVWHEGEHQKLRNGKTVISGIDTIGAEPEYDKLGIYRSQFATGTSVVYDDDYHITNSLFSEPPS